MNAPRARKRFGQHFLHDPAIIGRILAAVAPGPEDHVVEIGPGRGALTRELAAAAGTLDVIEIDRDLAALLASQDWAEGVRIHAADALRFDFASLATPGEQLRLVGNLPYNISTPLLFRILKYTGLFIDAYVMLQREVVERMCAAPGTREYGRLTVALAARCTVRKLFTIRPGAFQPAPRVDSAFARLVPLEQPMLEDQLEPAFDQLVNQAFTMRRKKLLNALQDLLSAREIEAAGVDPGERAGRIGVNDWVRLSRIWHESGMRRSGRNDAGK